MKYLTALLLAIATPTAWADLTTISVPASASKGVKETVAAAWPKAVKACPGFKKYEEDLSFKEVEDNYSYAPAHAKRIEVVFKVSESPKQIPGAYRASGHTCYFSISPDGSTLSISKSPCASICADQGGVTGDFTKKL
jgi:hypothetical protein